MQPKYGMNQLWIVIGLVGLAVIGLCIRIILKKDGRFSSTDIGRSEAMRKRGISCIRTQDAKERIKNKNKIDIKKL